MKHLTIFVILIISTFFINSTIVKQKEQPNEGRKLYFYLDERIHVTSLMSNYLYIKYLGWKKVLHWDSDENWAKRFFHYYQSNSITLKYINLLIDSYGSELMNHCIVIFKVDYEKAQNELLTKFLDNASKDNTFSDKINPLKYEEKERNALNKQDKKIYKQFIKDYWGLTPIFETNVGYCYDFYKYIKDHGFITKYIFQADSVLLYYKNSKNYVEMNEKDRLSWTVFMQRLVDEFNNEEHFLNFQENHKTYFYTIINFFVNKKSYLKTYLEVSGKLR